MKRLNWKLAIIMVSAIAAIILTVYYVNHTQRERRASIYKEEGKDRLKAGDLENAIKALRRYLDDNPDDKDALKDMYTASKEIFEATPDERTASMLISSINQYLIRVPDDVEALRDKLKYSRTTDKLDALARLRELNQVDEQSLVHQAYLEELERKDNKAAINTLARVVGLEVGTQKIDLDVAKKTERYEAFFHLARLLCADPQTRDLARKVLDTLEDLHTVPRTGPDNKPLELDEATKTKLGKAALYACEGWLLSPIQNNLNAARNMEKAKKYNPNDINILKQGYLLALNENQPEEAERIARNTIENFPNNPQGYKNLLVVLNQRPGGRLEMLKVCDDALLNLKGTSQLDFYKAKFQLLLRSNKPDLAVAREIVSRLRTFENSQFQKEKANLMEAEILTRELKWTQALEILLKNSPLLTDEEDIVSSNELKGRCYEALNQYDQAINLYMTSLNKNKENLDIRNRLAMAYLQAGKIEEARRELEIIASRMNVNQMVKFPSLWQSLLHVRILEQALQPTEKQNWSKVDLLVSQLKTVDDADLPRVDKEMVEAEVLSRKGKHQEALAKIEEFKTLSPENIAIWKKWCEIYSRFKKPQDLLAEIAKAPESVRQDYSMILIQGNQLALVGGPEGKAGLQNLISGSENNSKSERFRLHLLVADALIRMEDYAAAQTLAEEARKLTEKDDVQIFPLLIRIAKETRNIPALEKLSAEIEELKLADQSLSLYARCQLILAQIRETQIKRQKSTDIYIILNESEKKQLAKALELQEQLMATRPQWGEVYKLRADIAGFQNRIPDLISSLRRAMQISELENYRMRQLAQLYFQTGAYKQAREIMNYLFREGDASLFKLNFALLIQENRKDIAAKMLESFVLSPMAPLEEKLWQAQALRQLEKYADSEKLLLDITQNDPKITLPEAWLSLVEVQQQLDQIPQAKQTLQTIMNAPSSDIQMLTAARCAEQLKEADLAIQLFPAAVEKFPNSLRARRELANFYLRIKLDRQAVSALDSLIEYAKQNPTDPLAEEFSEWALRAKVVTDISSGNRTYQEFLRYDQALATAAAQNPTEYTDLVLRINLLSGRPEPASIRKAIDLFADFEKRTTLQLGDRLLLAQLHQRAGNWNKTKEIMQKLALTQNADPKMMVIFAEMLFQNEDFSTAEQYITDYVNKTNDKESVKYLLGCVYVKQNRTIEGLKLLAEYLGTRPVAKENLPKLQRVAMQLENLKQFDAAENLYKELAQHNVVGQLLLIKFQGRHRDPLKAITALDAIATKEPESAFNATAIGIDIVKYRTSEMKSSELEQAWQQLDKWFAQLKQAAPQDTRLPSLEADIRTVQGRPKEAVVLYKKALTEIRDSSSQDAGRMCNNLAYAIAMTGDQSYFADGMRYINRAIDIMGPQSDLLDTRGLLYLLSGDFASAETDYLDAVLVPSGTKFYRLAYCSFRLNKEDAARTNYRKAKHFSFDHRELVPQEQALFQEFRAKFDTGNVAGQ